VWPAASLSSVLGLTFWNVRANTPNSKVFPKGLAVVAFVGIQFKYTALCSDTQFTHDRFGTDDVVPVAFGGHVGKWQTVPLG
jgi:hypothetical protein